jgi:esterase/lipase
MSTPFRIPYDYPIWLIRLLSRVIPFQPKGGEEPGSSWYDKAAYQEHISYPQNPVRSGAELQQLAAQMRRALPAVEVPVLLIHSRNDDYVLPGNMENIFNSLGTAVKRKIWVTEAGHVITRDAARGEVFSAAAKFIHQIESST